MSTLTRNRNIEHWDAEDVEAWEAGGKHIARRNLIWSVFAEHVGFSIWSIWSVMVLFMPAEKYGIDAAGKFFLMAVPTLVGAVLRIPYTVATARFGGRNWTVFSALLLLVPTLLTLYFINQPGTSYTTFLVVAAFAGVGGGNFASSMTNINAFYPQRLKGWALGLNAGGGNIGVPVIQLIGLLVIATLGNEYASLICAIYLVLIAITGLGAALYMDNLRNQKADLSDMVTALKVPQSWAIAFLYIGTFGSFIGYSFAFGQILQISFKAGGDTAAQAALHAAQIAFIGPLLGSLARPYGGKWADRIGGSRVALVTFGAMMAAAALVIGASTVADGNGGVAGGAVMAVLVIGFVALFVLSGIGNGAVTKIIPSVFDAKSRSLDLSPADRAAWSQNTSGALIGFVGAIGALGGVGINLVLRSSYASTNSATTAFWVFLAFYVVCAAVTWLVFLRRPSLRSVADDDVVVEAEALVRRAEQAVPATSSVPSARA
ncbi:MFS transporter, NNP family, nitrate/nitrite transporter [Nocardia farcinica]|uniref:Nitrite facilitator 1 n=1 Tax=Nocardia farcinica TaxID=37329 RepID=A0A0H5P5Z2_NOCFR|nr:nitrate/nitrite transporter [Nocardia farcinica]AXK89798.1 NarK/NasA family nitrate transporter [Nocardia farcinica]MBA4854871.1 NarK/NasA family nitrate transporter [Nocardia farcinica]MBC9814966.1 NarK/NasA family nitrate transporter [Nocardia farcinica]MBF6070416.1 NarK/NasA family nitrate transporter [Nocardia farcinica]MBF6269864.1 NarK/NasA family nitrate transporter [Nocardia farcinica]